MNKLERSMNAINGKPVDRPPVCFWKHFGMQEPEETVRLHLDYYRRTGIDMLKMMMDEFFTYPMDVHATPEEILKMKPLGKNSYYVRGQVERATQINEALKGESVTLYNAFNPYATLKHTLGDAESMALIRNHEEAALHLLEIICEDTCDIVEGILKESGTMGMMLCLQGAEINRFSEEDYKRIVEPTEKRVVECAQALSENNLMHMCGWDCIPNRLEWWLKYPVKMVSWAIYTEKISLGQARTRFGDRVLVGGYDNRPGTLLHTGSKEDIQEYARRILREVGSERLFVGADCSIPQDIDLERVHWVVEALEEAAVKS